MEAHYNLGNALDKNGLTPEAIDHYLEALRVKPDFVAAHNNLDITLFHKGDIEELQHKGIMLEFLFSNFSVP